MDGFNIEKEMDRALKEEQFCVYYQPKYNIITEQPSGAEALVRWLHPEQGMISPGEFIPTFERNGFISKLDYYVWEKTCKNLRRWTDMGLNPAPISVNVSRKNLDNSHIVEDLAALVDKYDIDASLLQLEITESAYMENPDMLNNAVNQFREKGFTILMDDFGSGYSSLNTLKDMEVDILKIDMKFMPIGDGNTKSEKILAAVARMANWLGMPTIVEGVETENQKNFLKGIGCIYAQGYYYARPMPQDEYEKLITEEHSSSENQKRDEDTIPELGTILSADSTTETILSGLSLPVAIFEYKGKQYDIIRANQEYYDKIGHDHSSNYVEDGLSDGDQQILLQAFKTVEFNRNSSTCEIIMNNIDGVPTWFRVHMKFIADSNAGTVVCNVYSDISQEKKAESEMNKIATILNTETDVANMMLIVDDEEVNRAILKNIFKDSFSILEATNGKEALDYVNIYKDEIKIILLDMVMPEMDGKHFLTSIRGKGDSNIPVIIISSDGSKETQVSMIDSGVNDYITKPFVPQLVKKRVANVIRFNKDFSAAIKENKNFLNGDAGISDQLTMKNYSLAEMKNTLCLLKGIFDLVRVVDPIDMSVITLDAEERLVRHPYSCFRAWNRGSRCDNCTSECAANGGRQMTKYEFINNNIFYVVSRPMFITNQDGSKVNVIIEIASHVSDSLVKEKRDNTLTVGEMVESIQRKIYTDPLTQVYNRRYLYEALFVNHNFKDSGKYTFIMMDLKGFKRINDEIGHVIGDEILSQVAQTLSEQIRSTDSVIRYGGDEFLLILAGCDEEYAKKRIEQIALALEKIKYGNDKDITVRARYGFACADNMKLDRTFIDNLIKKADQKMYSYDK